MNDQTSKPRESSDGAPQVPGQPAVAAFFDMDKTLLTASSGWLYLKWLWQTRQLPLHQWIHIAWQVALYIIGAIDFPRLMSRLMIRVAGSSESEAWRMSKAWFETALRHAIAPGGPERIAFHKQQGHHVAIVSAATPYAVKPIAEALGLGDAFLATELEVIGGCFTGKVLQPACFGPGKVARTRGYAEAQGIDLAASYFYSDSASDLPLLDAVGRPVAVNPSSKLARIAKKRGWPILKFY